MRNYDFSALNRAFLAICENKTKYILNRQFLKLILKFITKFL